ncbi:HCL435Wp [Eremothecium sinecaudum]|uniref:Cytochrome c oxidase-assembly factor COX23, mitochondrial n=1 Tax=Eremothecium sinecaudum TaxID=45286 RepID=A0A109UW89_9SACH|nr:HCL435Wp [Eremothecium sinecaudum]AMD19716.1 HCL435Wp [Eremothecium sinecaudum]
MTAQDSQPPKKETNDKESSKITLDSSKIDPKPINFTPDLNDTSSYKFYPDDPESPLNRFSFVDKGASRYYDPCQESAQMSIKCLERNNYDRKLCYAYFDAYRECKKQWLKSRREDRSKWQ